jgi:D-galactarolactone isomerase
MDRRKVIGGISGIAVSGAAQAAGEPSFAVPAGACDCHVHVYDARFPYKPDATLKPKPGDVPDYRRSVQRPLHLSRAVILTPSTYGTDNRCTLDALKQFGDTARGVGVVAPEVSDAELNALNAAGLRGLRLGFKPEQLTAIAKRIAPLGWHLQFFRPGAEITALESTLLNLPVPIVLDHLGHVEQPGGMNSAGYKTIRKLLDAGRCWIKVSGAYIDSKSGPPDYADTSALAKSYIAAAPQRCLWASNWPFPDVTAGPDPRPRPDVLPFFELFGRWVPDAKLRHRILVENPEQLYGFDPKNRPKPA